MRKRSFFLVGLLVAFVLGAVTYRVFHNPFYALGVVVAVFLIASHGDPRELFRRR